MKRLLSAVANNALSIFNTATMGAFGAFYVGLVIGFGFSNWVLVRVIIERAEIGWYLLWMIPVLLFTGSGFLTLVVIVPFVVLSDWQTERNWNKHTRAKSDKDDRPRQ